MATEENGHKNDVATDIEIPAISNGAPSKAGKKRPGVFGLGSSGGQAAGVGVARSGIGGFVVNNVGFLFKIMPLMSTIVLCTIMPAINRAASLAEYEQAKAAALALRSDTPLPSDAAVAKMRQNSNLDNEALVRSKHAGSGMKFGDEEYAEQKGEAGEDAAAKPDSGAAPGGAPASDSAKAIEEAQAAAAAQQQTKFGESSFGKSGFGDAAGGGGGGSGGGSGFTNKTVNYAPEAKFAGGLKKNQAGKGQMDKAAAQSKALGKGGDARKLGGRAKSGRGQLRQAMHFSKNARGMKGYQASAATASRAFDGGTVTSDVASGIGGSGAGAGGAGAGEAEDQAAMDDPSKFGDETPKMNVEKPKAVPNESCEGKNLDEMQKVMGDTDYNKLKSKCEAQKKCNEAFLWLAAAAVTIMAISIARTVSDGLKQSVFPATVAAGTAMHIALLAVAFAIIAAAVIIAVMAASEAGNHPSLKGQATGLYIGATITTVSAVLACVPYSSGASLVGSGAIMSQMASAGSNAMQGMQGDQ